MDKNDLNETLTQNQLDEVNGGSLGDLLMAGTLMTGATVAVAASNPVACASEISITENSTGTSDTESQGENENTSESTVTLETKGNRILNWKTALGGNVYNCNNNEILLFDVTNNKDKVVTILGRFGREIGKYY